MEFRILGPLEVDDGGRLLSLPAAQGALLVILLLHEGEVVSSDRLVDDLWGDDPPDSGLTALQVRVSQLRKALGDSGALLQTRAPGYVLRLEPEQLDLHRFSKLVAEADSAEPPVAAERLREALALWRGEPLADFAYEAFAQAAIGRLEDLRLAALERRLDADFALGRHTDLVGELEALVADHPLRERFRAQLMLALYRSGRQVEALEVYQSARRSLVEELGIEPGHALQELELAVLRQDPSLELERLEQSERSILVGIREESRLDALLGLAEPLARRPRKELILARAVNDPEVLGEAARAMGEHREALLAAGVTARAAAFVSTADEADLVRMAIEQDVDLVLVDGRPELLVTLLAGAPCDVAVLIGGGPADGPVLVPFVGAAHDWASVELGAWLAGALERPLLLAGPVESVGSRDASRLLASASLAVQRALGVAAEPVLIEPGPDALLALAAEAGVVSVGLTERWRTEGLGPVREALATRSPTPVVLVRRGLRPGGLAPARSLTRFTWSLRG